LANRITAVQECDARDDAQGWNAGNQKIINDYSMNYLSIEPFIPSGKDFDKSKQLFLELGFSIDWDGGELVGFKNGNCKFILQKYDNKAFAENLMLSVKVTDINEFWNAINKKNLSEKFGIAPITQPIQQPYGKEVNIIDIAGVCWHFIEELS